jgi:serine/threonine protein kinase
VEALKPHDPSHLGNWTLTGRLGEGEDSVIYLGYRGIAGSEQAAIKLIEDDTFEFEAALEKIRNEVGALQLLNDENIVKLLDANYEQGSLWIATEYIHGVTLDTKLKQTKEALSEQDWFKLAENIFHALKAAHEKGVIHKDIKPTNIILSQTGAKLIDFGISHVPEKTRSANPGDFEGSRLFSAPENYNRKNIPEMDVFSAGVTLAYAAKLKSVWKGENQDAITESIKKDAPDLSGLKPLQVEFVKPLLEKLPIDRPSSAEVHKKALEYIEYLMDQENKKKPMALRVKKTLLRRFDKPLIKFGVPISLSVLLITGLFAGNDSSDLKTLSDPFPSTASSTEDNFQATEQLDEGSNTLGVESTSIDCENAYVNAKRTIDEFCLAPAKAGDVRSIFYMGKNASSNGRRTDAEKWFLLAAAKGDVSSMGQLAQIYLDQKEAAKYKTWVTRCADYTIKSNAGARCKLLIGIDLLNANEISKGILYLKDSVDYGNGSAATVLGMHYAGLEQKELALNWFVKSAELGDSTGLSKLITLANQLGKTDLYMKWLKTSADDGNGEYAWMLAMEYLDKEDYRNSKKYAEIGANAGDKNAMGILGIILYKIDNDLPKAKVWLKRAAAGDDVKAINVLGLIARVEDKNYQDSINWYKKSAALGDLEAGFWMGAVYAGGLNDEVNACNSFKGVVIRSDELKRLGTFDAATMATWLTRAQDGIKETC